MLSFIGKDREWMILLAMEPEEESGINLIICLEKYSSIMAILER